MDTATLSTNEATAWVHLLHRLKRETATNADALLMSLVVPLAKTSQALQLLSRIPLPITTGEKVYQPRYNKQILDHEDLDIHIFRSPTTTIDPRCWYGSIIRCVQCPKAPSSILQSASFLGDAALAVGAPFSLVTVPVVSARAADSIERFPPIQYLFPVYNFQDLLDSIGEQFNANTPEGIRQASESVDQFLAGGFVSNKNVFKSLCTIYVGEIKYAAGADRKAIQNAFLADCDQIVDGIIQIQKPLKSLVQQGVAEPTKEVLEYFQETQRGLDQFLGRIPQQDIFQLKKLIQKVKETDANQNGRLDRDELNSFSDQELEVYKTVGDLLFQAKS